MSKTPSTPTETSTYLGHLDSVTRSATHSVDRSEVRLPGLTVLCHPDLRRVGERAVLPALASDQEAHLSRLEPLFSQPGSSERRPLGDPRLSRSALVLRPLKGGGVLLINPSGRIRISVDGKPVVDQLRISREQIENGLVWLIANQIALALHPMEPLSVDGPRFGLVGDGLGAQHIRRQISRVADLEVPCLIRGETGTGKELVALAIHRASQCSSRPFEALNMGAIPPTLAAAELFGAVKGAYTGADRKRLGAFSRADGGTLFLDEIGETPPEIQVLLLRALETHKIRPVGGDRELDVSVRILAATDTDLEGAIAQGRFREPLVHRLSGYEIHLPPLRRRLEDFGRLLVHFLRLELGNVGESDRFGRPGRRTWLPAPLVAQLAAYPWPGNIRQLRNVARQLVIANRGKDQLRLPPDLEHKLTLDPPTTLQPAAPTQSPTVADPTAGDLKAEAPTGRQTYRPPDEVDEEELIQALKLHAFRLQPTAAALGISRTSLYALIEKSSHLRKAKDLSRDEIRAAKSRHGDDLDAMAADLEVSRKGLRRQMTRLEFD